MTVRPIPPFRLDFTVWALRRRPRNGIDRWDGSVYRRVVKIGTRITELAVRQSGSSAEPRLTVTATPPLRTQTDRSQVRSIVDRLLGLQVDLSEWYRLAHRDRRLGELADRFRGLKPPRFPTVFEALVNAFACQQLSLEVGLELLNRLAAVCHVTRRAGERAHYAFPAPHDVARVAPARYHAIGFSRQKIRALLTLARGIDRGKLDVERLECVGDEEAASYLRELHGVGRWTAEYGLLRGLGRLDVFPGDDVGAQKSLARWLGGRIRSITTACARSSSSGGRMPAWCISISSSMAWRRQDPSRYVAMRRRDKEQHGSVGPATMKCSQRAHEEIQDVRRTD